jgi:hypothetical protein
MKRTVWKCIFYEGTKNEEFAQSLEAFIHLLKVKQKFLNIFTAEGGEISLTLNRSIAFDDGVLMQLELQPFFLQVLGDYGVGLQIQAWSEDEGLVAKSN